MNVRTANPLVLLSRFRKWLLTQAWFRSRLLPALPRQVRWTLRKLYFLPFDTVDRVAGRATPLVPPKSKIFTGSVDDFVETGEKLVNQLVDLECMDLDAKVLDVGSGMGRLAVALIAYRADRGEYEGLEIVSSAVTWCKRTISADHPSYRFTHADIYNKEYNPRGRLSASTYRFPFDDDTFDVVVLVSVFTHMLPADMEHYVSEIARVTTPGGKCYVTFHLLDDESKRCMDAGESESRFDRIAEHWIVDAKVPELAVAYEEAYVRSLFERYGQSCEVHYGWWSGRSTHPEDPPRWDQDVVLVTKR
jgi:SAM-dependent methyltransferase